MLHLTFRRAACGSSLLVLALSLVECTEAKGPRPAGQIAAEVDEAPSEGMDIAPGVTAKLQASEADIRSARGYYMTRCRVCHGDAGRGDGPMAGTLRPSPRTFVSATWQQSVRDRDIAAIIVNGGAAMGRSAAMPAAPELERKPGVLAGLVQVVRGFGESTP